MLRISVVLAAVAAGMMACSSTDEGGYSGTTAGHDSVSVGAAAFSPSTVIPNGAGVVKWNWNSGGVTHNITFEALITGSGVQSTGSFQQTFSTPGTYRYRCTIHSTSFASGMVGKVVLGSTGDPKDPYDPY